MRGLVLTVIVAAAACNLPHGLQIEVFVEEGTKVELFAGQYCFDCPRGVVLNDGTPAPITDVYLNFDPIAQPETAGGDGMVTFRIETEHDTHLGIILVVATTREGRVSTFVEYNFWLKTSTRERWQINRSSDLGLVDTGPLTLFGVALSDGVRGFRHWNAIGSTAPDCVVFEQWNEETVNGQTVHEFERALIVPEDDHDCDGIKENECAPWQFNAPLGEPKIETAACLAKDAIGACRIQGHRCSETGPDPTADCAPLPEDYCVPEELCICGTPLVDQNCFATTVEYSLQDGAAPMSHLSCTIQLDHNGYKCDDVYVDAEGKFGLGATQCTAIRMADLMMPFGPFVTEKRSQDGSVALKLVNFAEPCSVKVEIEGSAMPSTTYGLVELALDNQHHLVLPARLELVANGCAVDSVCEFYDEAASGRFDGLAACVTGLPRQCTRSEHCDNGGTYCNGTCCAPGERCTPNGCACGTIDGEACMTGDHCVQTIYSPDQCGNQCCGISPCAAPLP